ncbi:MAG: chorismate synthase, partial [Candidatus Fraserbacteria bacterium RBG_16_55_9]
MRYLTAGESHGRALVGILEGLPAGLSINLDDINKQLQRRQQGYGRGGRMLIEKDQAEILSGIRFGKTLGSPIALVIWNRDWENWKAKMDPWQEPLDYKPVTVPRPGHADLAGAIKYQQRDIRNVLERASARETAMRVAVGALARQLLEHFHITIASHVTQIHDAKSCVDHLAYKQLNELNEKADSSPVRCLDSKAEKEMIARIQQAMHDKNTVGGAFAVIARGVPPGLGSHVHWDRKLDGRIAQALMSIQAIKAVGVGLGFEVASIWGSEAHDPIYYELERGFYRKTSGAGGIEGGMSTGTLILIRVAMKPLSTLSRPLDSVDIVTKEPLAAHIE